MSDAITVLSTLHARAKRAALNQEEHAAYDEAKEAVAKAICASQRTPIMPGHLARASFRVAAMLKVEVTLGGVLHRSVTMDVSLAGFSAILPQAPPSGATATFRFSRRDFAIAAHGVAIGSQRTSTASSQRVSFAFTAMNETDVARLEGILFDHVLESAARAIAAR